MADLPVNKSALIREYLHKYPRKGPSEIARLITQEKGINMTGKFVATIKTKLAQADTRKADPKRAAARKSRLAAKPAAATAAHNQAKPAAPTSHGMAEHIANLKAAAHFLGKDEAKRILDLF